MSTEIISTRHGLSVYSGADDATGADTAANRRLRRPVDEVVSNTFNDATSGHRYKHPAGHEGIDFDCKNPTNVKAMYGGEVIRVVNRWASGQGKPYGNLVTIRSYTDQDAGLGFEHTYTHLQYREPGQVIVTERMTVAKGDRIGVSGDTGTDDPHLHVHLQAFGPNGTVTNDDDLGWDSSKDADYKQNTDMASRILGCLNFACFLPADEGAKAPAITKESFLNGSCRLLSPRDAYAKIRVFKHIKDDYDPGRTYARSTPYNNSDGTPNRTYEAFVDGSEIACYAVLDEGMSTPPGTKDKPSSPVIWYKIRHSALGDPDATGDTIEGWVPSRGMVNSKCVTWVTVEEDLEVPRTVQLSATAESVTVSWKPPANAAGVRGYHIWRGISPESLKKIHQARVGTTAWTDQPTTPLGTLYYYAVSAYWTNREGEYCPPVGVITGHGTLGGSKTLAVADANTHIRPTPNTGPNSLAVMLPSVFREVKGVLWQNKRPVSLAVALPPAQPPATTGEGWVPAAAVKVLGTNGVPTAPNSPAGLRLLAAVAARSHLRLRAWVTGLHLRTGPSTAFAIHRLLTDTAVWYEVTGQTATTPVWYRIRHSDTFQGWVRGDYVELSEAAPAVATVTPPTMPAETGPAHEAGTGTGTTTGAASGDFRNLVTNPDGRWAVSKSGTTVTANFSSPRSPVQYHARQNPQPQFVLPVGFRPTATVPRTVSGTQVHENRKPVPNAPAATFDLTIGTNGEMRYVNNSKVDHLGYVGYSVTGLTWQSNETLTTPARPGDTQASGVYLNQQVNRGSSWELERSGNAVSGSFGCTRSPVQYFANGSTRAAQLLLPAAYRPRANARFQVKGAVRVNEDGSDSTDTRKVDFWLTVQTNGEMWYDTDTNLQTLGVGYLRYTVNVAWTAAPRITVPGIPRELEAEDIEATALELDWRSPAENGGASIDGYRIQVWDADNEEWDTEESDTNSTRTRYDVEDLDPYTTYRFRVAAHNRAGWGAFGPAITATTRRKAPGAPASLSATAAHDAVTLTWGTVSGTVTGYRLQRRVGRGSWLTLVADTGTTARAFVDRTVSPATAYRYRVAAHNRGEAGAWSQERSITTAAAPTIPGQVTGLAVAPGTGSRLQLTWTAPTDTGGGITGHRIERSPDTTPRTWTVVQADTGVDTVGWGDNDVAADTTYRYRVSARNSAGIGTPSAEAMGHSRPQLRLGGRLSYPLTAHASPWSDAPVTATWAAYLPGRAYDLVGRVPGADGWWRVLLFDRDAQSAFWLPAAAGTSLGTTTALPQPPAAPAGFTASLAGGTVTLGWTAPASGATATGYRLWRQEDNGAWTQLGQDLDATTLTATDRAVRNGHVYRYRLQAQSDRGLGLPTVTVALAVMAIPAAPAAVTGLQATATTTTLQLGWTRATTGGLPVAYRVRWRVADTADDFQEAESTGTAHTLTNLLPDTAYVRLMWNWELTKKGEATQNEGP